MTTIPTVSVDGNLDVADKAIISYLTLDDPKSFFLFAGAGSGKTRSLVTALNGARSEHGKGLRLRGQQIGVITYTNAACDEIKRRLDFDPLFEIATIHSFVWSLIQGFNADIRGWLHQNISEDLRELHELQQKGRRGTQASVDRARSIEAAQNRLDSLKTIKRFIYSPTGENRSSDSLNHSEVIKIGAAFLTNKSVMQQLLIRKFPILLIDESQDTNRALMDALFRVQKANPKTFCLGLFGDTMQRIYADGKVDLAVSLPADWQKPEKPLNHRCPSRIVALINKIRSSVDTHEQRFPPSAIAGHARLFISRNGGVDRTKTETIARAKMAEVTGDAKWKEPAEVRTLTLEHHMAAKRLNFLEIFEPLDQIAEFSTGLRDGTLPMLRFFSELVLPLVRANAKNNPFSVASIVRKASPLLAKTVLESAGKDQLNQLKAAKLAVDELSSLCSKNDKARFIDVLRCVAKTGLFEIPSELLVFISPQISDEHSPENTADLISPQPEISKRLLGVRRFLETPFSQIMNYTDYVKGQTPFGTHQGVKGLEFPRVMVVMDDEESRGFLLATRNFLEPKRNQPRT